MVCMAAFQETMWPPTDSTEANTLTNPRNYCTGHWDQTRDTKSRRAVP